MCYNYLDKFQFDERFGCGFSGSEIGAALDALLQKVMDGELPNEKETLLEALKR